MNWSDQNMAHVAAAGYRRRIHKSKGSVGSSRAGNAHALDVDAAA